MSNLARWNPLTDIQSLWNRDLFGRDLFSRLSRSGELAVEWNPRSDVVESDDEIVVHVELPGVDAKDMNVSISESVLTVKGEKKVEKEGTEDGNAYSERFFGSFSRSLSIPSNVDAAAIKASLQNGVLEVRLPKVKVTPPTATSIPIEAK